MRLIILTIVILSLAQSTVPAIQNRLLISGPDQWRDIVATKLILEEGDFVHAAAYSGGYYSSIPLFSILNATITLVTGDVYFSFVILSAVMGLVMAFSIYLALWKLAANHIASIVGVFAFLSIPRLATDMVIPSTLSIALASLLIFLLVKYILVSKRGTLLTILIVSFSTLVFHPDGIIALIVLCGTILSLLFVGIVKDEYPKGKMLLGVLTSICILSFAYWSLSSTSLLVSMTVPFKRFVGTISVSTSSIYSPHGFQSGVEIYSLAWALPVAMSAAYVVSLIYFRFAKKLNIASNKILPALAPAAAVAGLVLVIVAFISVINSPGAAVERYVASVAYLLLLLPLGVMCSQLIHHRKKISTICILTLLSIFVFVGSASPEWSPYENPASTIVHATYDSLNEAKTMASLIPNNPLAPVIIYDDHDIAVGGVASLSNISVGDASSNQVVAHDLDNIKDGTFYPFNRVFSPIEIFIIIKNEVRNATAINEYTNILYDSGRHYMLRVPFVGGD